MEKLKIKYEALLGFVTLVISLSAFKDELSKIVINLGYCQLTLSQYFLYCVIGFCICLYFYIAEYLVRDTKIGNWKIFDYFIWIAFILFSFILVTPILLLVNALTVKFFVFVLNNIDSVNFFSKIMAIVSSSLTLITSFIQVFRSKSDKKISDSLVLKEKEIIELEKARKLFESGFYSHSILESYKVLETHLKKRLTEKDIRIVGASGDLVRIAFEKQVISKAEFETISGIKIMRNVAAHKDVAHNENEAREALSFVTNLIS